MKPGVGSALGLAACCVDASPDPDLDRHHDGNLDPDPDQHQHDADPQHCIKLKII